ncbi:MAG: hypothetical protein IJD06_03985 [Clostridia bacterium]|nr:hypothetical protein [Clostridia bacterium]
MKKLTRILAALLTAVLLLPACAQNDDGQGAQDTTASAADPAVTTEAVTTLDPNLRANHFDNLPADINFDGGTVTVLFRGTMADLEGTTCSYWIRNDICGTDNIGDPVSDLVWERNQNVAERLNISLTWIPTEGGSLQGDQQVIKSSIMASSDDYNVLLTTANTSASMGLNVYMRDISHIPHVDYAQPWWWEFANEAFSLDGKTRQFIVGDMLLTNLAQTGVLFFNKDLYTDAYGDPDELYKLTLDGKLTYDKLYELVQGAYQDANGDGKQDEGDIYGMCYSSGKTEELSHMVMACDLDMYTFEDGTLTITMNNDRTVKAIETLYKMVNETGAAWSITESITGLSPVFTEGHSMFMCNRLGQAAGPLFREMEEEFGILPLPKLDEEQDMYISYPHDSGTVLAVPKNVGDDTFTMVGATLEALCGEAHRTYIDAFLETALKMKYSRDALSGQCIDLVMAGLTKNTLMEYVGYTATIVNTCIYTPIKSNPAGFAASYRKVGPAAQKQWDKFVRETVGG